MGSDLIQFLYTDYFKITKIIVDVTCVAFGFIFLNRMNKIIRQLKWIETGISELKE